MSGFKLKTGVHSLFEGKKRSLRQHLGMPNVVLLKLSETSQLSVPPSLPPSFPLLHSLTPLLCSPSPLSSSISPFHGELSLWPSSELYCRRLCITPPRLSLQPAHRSTHVSPCSSERTSHSQTALSMFHIYSRLSRSLPLSIFSPSSPPHPSGCELPPSKPRL